LELVRNDDNYEELTPELKKKLLMISSIDIKMKNQSRPLMLAVQQTVSSLYKCYERSEKIIIFPEM